MPSEDKAILFQVKNYHVASCGDPPEVRAEDANTYYGYFQNSLGEQIIFTCDRMMGTAEVRLGDAGWHNVYPVKDGMVIGVMLTTEERLWLKACWVGSRHFRKSEE